MKGAGPITAKRTRNFPKGQLYECPRCGIQRVQEWRGPKGPNPVCPNCRVRMKSVSGVFSNRTQAASTKPKRKRHREKRPENGSLLDLIQSLFR